MSTHVAFFGGFRATQANMNAWRGSAYAQRPNVQFNTFPYPPGADSSSGSAASAFSGYGPALESIESSRASQVFLVGHSSGCAIANEVDRRLTHHENVVLVALDGVCPDGAQLKRPSTQVWVAECGKARSLHYDYLKGIAGARLCVHKAHDCNTTWALHFSLVNLAASDSTIKSIRTGYVSCRANLEWMEIMGDYVLDDTTRRTA